MNIIRKGLRHYCRLIAEQIMEVKTYEVLSRIIKENNFKTYIEVGVWKGETLFNIAKLNPNIHIIGIDDYTPSNYTGYVHGETMALTDLRDYQEIKKTVLITAQRYLTTYIITEKSLNAIKFIPDGSQDIIFIDALHDYKSVAADIKAWLPKVSKGGILCGHDYKVRYCSVIKAVGDTLGYDNITVDTAVSMWIHRKK